MSAVSWLLRVELTVGREGIEIWLSQFTSLLCYFADARRPGLARPAGRAETIREERDE